MKSLFAAILTNLPHFRPLMWMQIFLHILFCKIINRHILQQTHDSYFTQKLHLLVLIVSFWAHFSRLWPFLGLKAVIFLEKIIFGKKTDLGHALVNIGAEMICKLVVSLQKKSSFHAILADLDHFWAYKAGQNFFGKFFCQKSNRFMLQRPYYTSFTQKIYLLISLASLFGHFRRFEPF